MNPISRGASSLNLSAREVGGDPLQPVTVGDIHPESFFFLFPRTHLDESSGVESCMDCYDCFLHAGYSYVPYVQEGYF